MHHVTTKINKKVEEFTYLINIITITIMIILNASVKY